MVRLSCRPCVASSTLLARRECLMGSVSWEDPQRKSLALSEPPGALLLLRLAPYAPPLVRHNWSIGRGVRLLRASLPLQDTGACSSSGRVVSFRAVSFLSLLIAPFLSTRISTVTGTETGYISHMTYLLHLFTELPGNGDLRSALGGHVEKRTIWQMRPTHFSVTLPRRHLRIRSDSLEEGKDGRGRERKRAAVRLRSRHPLPGAPPGGELGRSGFLRQRSKQHYPRRADREMSRLWGAARVPQALC
jgi:hypothetical protein